MDINEHVQLAVGQPEGACGQPVPVSPVDDRGYELQGEIDPPGFLEAEACSNRPDALADPLGSPGAGDP
jgi:hypothetical protein